jgi:hypothetical protein
MRSRFVVVNLVLILLALTLLVAPVAASPAALTCGPNVTYYVRPGDNLFRIALNHGTTMQAIASANGITNYARIYAGSVLRIPCAGGSVFQPPVYQPPVYHPPIYQPPVWVPPVYHPPVGGYCGQLVGTSPLEGMRYGDQTFYWNPLPGATSYRVNVYSVDVNPGNRVAQGQASAPLTSLTLNVGGPAGPGFRFSWEVQALVGSTVVCTSPRYTMFREAP